MAEEFNTISDPTGSAKGPNGECSESFAPDLAGSLSELMQQYSAWEEKYNSLFETQFQIIDRLDALSKKIDSLASEGSDTEPDRIADGNSFWEGQKSRLLESHGVSPSKTDPQPPESIEANPPSTEDVNSDVRSPKKEPASENQSEVSEPDEIIELRGHLEKKLRESEIEISIERARIGREKRELDRLRAEFEAEVLRMREEESPNGKRIRKDSNDRWSKFLGG